MCRGNNKTNIFHEDEDYLFFLELMVKCKIKYQINIHNFVLMTNHFHLLLYCPVANKLNVFVKALNVNYVNYYRKKYSGIGHFMQDRYKSIIIENGQYLWECARYIEYNPVKAGMVSNPANYKWSSFKYYTENFYSDIIDKHPLFSKTFCNVSEYTKFVLNSANEKRSEERIFRDAIYGSLEFRKKMKEIGIIGRWSHKGRPKTEK